MKTCGVALLVVVLAIMVSAEEDDSTKHCHKPDAEHPEPCGGVVAEVKTCPEPYFLIGNRCYWFPDALREMEDSHVYCAVRDPDGHTATLAVLDDCETFASVANYIANLKSNKSYWLGGTDFFEEDNWFWLNKKKVLTGAPFWEPGQPDGGLKENNLIINHHGHLEDRDPSELHPFICQLK